LKFCTSYTVQYSQIWLHLPRDISPLFLHLPIDGHHFGFKTKISKTPTDQFWVRFQLAEYKVIEFHDSSSRHNNNNLVNELNKNIMISEVSCAQVGCPALITAGSNLK
jgi:hypothetical protein